MKYNEKGSIKGVAQGQKNVTRIQKEGVENTFIKQNIWIIQMKLLLL